MANKGRRCNEDYRSRRGLLDVQLELVWVFDCVSSVGVDNKTYPNADELDGVVWVRHALASNDSRVKFLPEVSSKLWISQSSG